MGILKQNRINKGFTLIELLVVIAIISVLASLLMANFVGIRQRGRDAERKSDLRQIQAALELYRADNGLYPTELAACGSIFEYDTGTSTVTYMQEVPCDPLSEDDYTYTSDQSTYTIYACIENANDSDAEEGDTSCDASTGVVYLLNNP